MWDKALQLARYYPNNGGMASIGVRWHPYEAGWQAEATWADDTRILTVIHQTPEHALAELIALLS